MVEVVAVVVLDTKKSNLAHKKLMKSEKIMKGFHILISVIVDLTSIEYCVSLVSYVMQ